MYNEQEIIAKCLEASLKSKVAEPSPLKKHNGKIPQYYPTYEQAIENAQAIKVHAEKGVFPYRLFHHRSPNQTAEEADYIEKTYKQVTLPVFMDYISTTSRAFNDANWSISYNPEKPIYEIADKSFQDYVEYDIKTYGSIENFIKSIVPTIKAIDAMGVIAIKPYELNSTESEDEQDINGAELEEPIPFYYESKQVVDYEDGEFYLIEMHEKSICIYGGQAKQIGRIYEFYDEVNIWRIKQVGDFTKNIFEAQLYFSHNEDKVPVTRLKGIPKVQQSEILWQSPFLYAVDNLDLVAMNASNLQISITKCVYPYAILLGDECEFEDTGSGAKCIGGYINDFEHETKRACPSCNGSGLKSRMNAMGQMILKPANRNDSGEFATSQKAIEYVSPPVDALKFLEDNIQKNETRARQILHLDTQSSAVQFNSTNKTATGSDNNQKALYSFVKGISDQIFEIYEFILDRIGWQRYGADYAGVNLIYPQAFDFLTDKDYLSQIAEAQLAGLPPFVIHSLIYKYLKALYFSEKKTSDVFNLIMNADRLITLSNQDIALKQARGTVDKWEEILHTSAITFVDQLSAENTDFFNQDSLIQKQQLIDKAKLLASEMQPIAATTKALVNSIVQ